MLNCHIVKDLLPNYAEGLTSGETAEDIAGHLENCAECRAVYEQMKAPIGVGAPDEERQINFLKKIKRRAWRNIAIASGLVACAAILIYAWAYVTAEEYDVLYNWNGEIVSPFVSPKERAASEEDWVYISPSDEEWDFLSGQKVGEIRMIWRTEEVDGSRWGWSGRTYLNTLEELEAVLKDADVPSFKAPTYIPAGYRIDEIVFMYHDQPWDMFETMMPVEDKMSANGNLMLTFELTENYRKHISYYIVSYVNEAKDSRIDLIGDFKEYFEYSASFPASSKSKMKTPVIDSFDKTVMVSNVRLPAIHPHGQHHEELHLYNYIVAVNKTEEMEPLGMFGGDFGRGYDSVEYRFYIEGDKSVNEKEMIKMVRGLKPVK